MTFADRIHALRNEIPGCRMVAFGDVRTRLVLRASHERGVRREFLDRLCHEAATCFGLTDVERQDSKGEEEAMVLTTDDVRIYLRGNENDTDFLCLVCDLESDPNHSIKVGHRALRTLTEVS